MDYSEQLKSPKWQNKRLIIMSRDNFMCKGFGGENSKLNVHHIKYIKGLKAWEYNNKLLITLCDSCHKIIHTAERGFNLEYLKLTPTCLCNTSFSDKIDYMKNMEMSFCSKFPNFESAKKRAVNNGCLTFLSIIDNRMFVFEKISIDNINKVISVGNFYDAKI